jgi:hypothetical protein
MEQNKFEELKQFLTRFRRKVCIWFLPRWKFITHRRDSWIDFQASFENYYLTILPVNCQVPTRYSCNCTLLASHNQCNVCEVCHLMHSVAGMCLQQFTLSVRASGRGLTNLDRGPRGQWDVEVIHNFVFGVSSIFWPDVRSGYAPSHATFAESHWNFGCNDSLFLCQPKHGSLQIRAKHLAAKSSMQYQYVGSTVRITSH